jgi:hypothetical protein
MKLLNIIFLVTVFLAISFDLHAQEFGKKTYKNGHLIGASVGVGSNEFAAALEWNHAHGFGKKNQRFKIGYGLRVTTYTGANVNYTTAPALLTSKQEGPQVLFSKSYEENIDTLSFSNTQVNSLNITIQLGYALTSKLLLGFNIDAVGLTFGGQRTGSFSSSLPYSNPNANQKATPTSYNVLLVSDNDIGTLNSEIFVRYWLSEKWAIKAGAMFLFTEYKTENRLTLNNDRFRNKTLMIMVGTSFKLFKE